MTAEKLIRVLLELDQQVISPRPSSWGKAALLVARLAARSEGEPWGKADLGNWKSVDLSPVCRRAPRELDQPNLDRILSEEVAS